MKKKKKKKKKKEKKKKKKEQKQNPKNTYSLLAASSHVWLLILRQTLHVTTIIMH